ncbi:MAG: hypothetical protein N3E46_12090 [Gemmataceae bacterium]|nr:hypothetical protein [Gemmataceae bacterium]
MFVPAYCLCWSLLGAGEGPTGPVRVTVVVILASSAAGPIDPALEELAREVRKREPKLRSFRLAAVEAQSIPVGQQGLFTLVEKQQAQVRIDTSPDARGRVRLTVSAPGVEQLSYTCVCDKYFPVVTPYRTRNGETLIIAIMAKPCTLTPANPPGGERKKADH